jgi:hypothetical protein
MPRRKLDDESRYRRMEERLATARTALRTLLPEVIYTLLSHPDCRNSEDAFR